ncbi:cytochrome P450 [Penicillium herquei]|nr:cytochrome P450 [Penicillium herquei]
MPNLCSLFFASGNELLNGLALDIHETTSILALIRTYGSIVGLLYLIYWIGVVIHRLTLHPLAHIPGPFLCRISSLQQCYFEAILNGRFLERFPFYHKKNDCATSLLKRLQNDSDHRIYKKNSMFTKDATSYALGVSEAMAFTIPVERHRQKRKTLDPSFSKSRVTLLEDGLYEELELVFDRIKEYEQRGEPVPLIELYFCYTGDIISRYLFGKSLDLVSSPDFVERIAVHFQFIRNILLALPRWILVYLNHAFVKVIWFTEKLAQQAIQEFNMEKALSKNPTEETIFDRLLTDNARREASGKEIRLLRFRELADECMGILNAGTELTATMLSYATYFWLKFPHVHSRVLEELASIQYVNGRLPLQQLENLPYFTGFVKESLRYMPLVPGRLPRTVPLGEGLFVPSTKQTIPPGSVVGMSHLAIHFDPDIFEQPEDFRPER